MAQGLNPHFPVILPLFYTVSTVQILLCRPSSSVPAIKSIASIFRLAAFDAPTQRLSPFIWCFFFLRLLPCLSTTCSKNMLFLYLGVIRFFSCPFSSSPNALFLFHFWPAVLCALVLPLLGRCIGGSYCGPFLCCIGHVFAHLGQRHARHRVGHLCVHGFFLGDEGIHTATYSLFSTQHTANSFFFFTANRSDCFRHVAWKTEHQCWL